MKITFDDFRQEYIDKIYEIEKDSIDVAWTKEQLIGLIGNPDVVARVGLLDGEVVCSYSFNIIIDEGDVNNLSVDKSWRGKGIGNLLIEDMILSAKSKNLQNITLEVNENNVVAINLYNKYGFKVEGKRPKFYHGKDAALVMWKRNCKI
ncbi:MAG: ribosomal protein S18-alanine N-acetyltransferase [Clostridiales bacterium]|nr:ribosomal protein S18-alanine N-acetyltransferase [Clostridiales bacterium]